jgi:hypothetical protein
MLRSRVALYATLPHAGRAFVKLLDCVARPPERAVGDPKARIAVPPELARQDDAVRIIRPREADAVVAVAKGRPMRVGRQPRQVVLRPERREVRFDAVPAGAADLEACEAQAVAQLAEHAPDHIVAEEVPHERAQDALLVARKRFLVPPPRVPAKRAQLLRPRRGGVALALDASVNAFRHSNRKGKKKSGTGACDGRSRRALVPLVGRRVPAFLATMWVASYIAHE